MGNGPAGPSAQTDNRVNLVLIVIALAFVLIMMLFKVARGEESQGMLTLREASYPLPVAGLEVVPSPLLIKSLR